jgi:hypothetical protein
MTVRGLFRIRRMDFGSSAELLTLFDNRVAAEETVRGHKNVGARLHAARQFRTVERAREAGPAKKLWLDQTEGMPVQGPYTVVGPGGFARPGSTVTLDFDKVDPDTWHIVSIMLDIATEKQSVFQPTARAEYRMSNFHNFDVQSTITVRP